MALGPQCQQRLTISPESERATKMAARIIIIMRQICHHKTLQYCYSRQVRDDKECVQHSFSTQLLVHVIVKPTT